MASTFLISSSLEKLNRGKEGGTKTLMTQMPIKGSCSRLQYFPDMWTPDDASPFFEPCSVTTFTTFDMLALNDTVPTSNSHESVNGQ